MPEVPTNTPKEAVPDIDLSDPTVPAEIASRGTERTASQERALAKQYRAMQSLYLGLQKAYRDLQESLKEEGITFSGIGLKRELIMTYVGYFKKFDLYAGVDEATLRRELEECAENDAFTQKIAYLDTLIEASYKRAKQLNEGDGTAAARAAADAQLARAIAEERENSAIQEAVIIKEIFGKRSPVEAAPTPIPPAAPEAKPRLLDRLKRYIS